MTLAGNLFSGGKDSSPRMGIDYTVDGTTKPRYLFSGRYESQAVGSHFGQRIESAGHH